MRVPIDTIWLFFEEVNGIPHREEIISSAETLLGRHHDYYDYDGFSEGSLGGRYSPRKVWNMAHDNPGPFYPLLRDVKSRWQFQRKTDLSFGKAHE